MLLEHEETEVVGHEVCQRDRNECVSEAASKHLEWWRRIHPGHSFDSEEVDECHDSDRDQQEDGVASSDRDCCRESQVTDSFLRPLNRGFQRTFLRTVGVNLVLARIGAVVCAESLSSDLFRLFSCIQISDSLVEGYSYFYAEVRRLKSLLDALGADDPLPLFFLIDEIFKGTNNRERLEGSRAYITSLIGQHGLGLVTTHDLELASIGGLINYHFSDSVDSGELTFDYRLRSGVSPTTNALRIMALAGLPVSV